MGRVPVKWLPFLVVVLGAAMVVTAGFLLAGVDGALLAAGLLLLAVGFDLGRG